MATAIELANKPPPAALSPLTDEEIAELRKLDSEAIAAPWLAFSPQGAGFEFHEGPGRGQVPANFQNAKLLWAARNILPRLLDFAERSRKLLSLIEWKRGKCPMCLGYPDEGHTKSCELAALIGAK